MKKNIILAAFALFGGLSMQAQKENKETIEGNGHVVTRDIPVQGFDALKATGIFELKLSQGSTEKVTIEADENLQEYFTVQNKGSKLVIDMEKLKNKNLKGKLKLTVYVTFKQLKDIDLNMVGNVRSEAPLTFGDLKISNQSVGNIDLKFTANDIDLKNESVGNISLSGTANSAVIHNQGVGSLKAGELVVQTVNIDNDGIGHAEVNAAKELKVKESFLGKVKNRGAAPVKRTGKVSI